MQRPLIIALDFPGLIETERFLAQFNSEQLYVKVGMELFYQEGPAMIHRLKEHGHSIFLDLKLHDIPNTVKSAMKGLARLNVDLVNVHCAGGSIMMEAALEGLEQGTAVGQKRPTIIGVTQLTSTSEKTMNEELLIERPLNDVVVEYSQLAKKSGLDGVVCSSLEVPLIRDVLGNDFVTVTPGIRLSTDEKGDQTRVVTPGKARELGSTGIVVGRSITNAEKPLEAYFKIKNSWEGVTV
ncbi:orotidine-5'-phosphate decarboxylase [Litchfieldia salsa]|uniref:Orotidine 5'-phosphate decarboxylase n=1 Tax=Litchfieldia salsa TaxID=930152 RepID=A0A1H0RC06_9BACI|nr:orotidine-5'-phosphate decarboxylase [Litchfieldia salsa]SDP27054.1 orotidine-5'-phosphate decarboxylase [Litchfieldia salsa]